MSDIADDQGAIRELFNTVELGLDARQFLESNLGRYVASRAQEDMFAASLELTTVPPHDQIGIAAIQHRYKVAAAALSWIGQAIEAGKQAEAALTAAENTD